MRSNSVRRIAGASWFDVPAEGGAVRVDVEDNGPGIAEADQHTIFEKFRQVGDTMTAKPQGTGLGLPISRQIVEHFGGRLWVESSLGKGATFSFTLPLKRENDDAKERTENDKTDTDRRRRAEHRGLP
jgi:signal transduction histidine kinase